MRSEAIALPHPFGQTPSAEAKPHSGAWCSREAFEQRLPALPDAFVCLCFADSSDARICLSRLDNTPASEVSNHDWNPSIGASAECEEMRRRCDGPIATRPSIRNATYSRDLMS